METVVVCGKFLPFHKGHEYLVETALDHAQKAQLPVHIMVITNDHDTISPSMRKDWILKTISKDKWKDIDTDVLILNDIYKDEDSAAWAVFAQDCLSEFEGVSVNISAVVTSEQYGETWAEEIGKIQSIPCQHICVDLDRDKVSISGTKVRNSFANNFQDLPDVVKEDLCFRVVVLGAESTGTSTLAHDLAKRLETPIPFEYGRWYAESLLLQAGGDPSKIKWEPKDFVNIANVQNLYEDQMATKAEKGMIICDTDALATEVFEQIYLNGESNLLKGKSRPRGDFYIITDYRDMVYEMDGTRELKNGSDEIRALFQNTLISTLEAYRKEYLIVSGSRQRRLEIANHMVVSKQTKYNQKFKRAID